MRVTFVLLAVLAAFAYSGDMSVGRFVMRKLFFLKRANPNMTQPECLEKCDGFLEPYMQEGGNVTDGVCEDKCHCLYHHPKNMGTCWQ